MIRKKENAKNLSGEDATEWFLLRLWSNVKMLADVMSEYINLGVLLAYFSKTFDSVIIIFLHVNKSHW